MKKLYCVCVLCLLLSACGRGAQSPSASPSQGERQTAGSQQVASSSQMAPAQEVTDPDMVPIYGGALKDGVYPIAVDSSSSMFNITACELTVQDGRMTAVLHMGATGYLRVFMGTGEEAAQAAESESIPFEEDAAGVHTFTVPVEALDQGIPCAAYSKKKMLWYDRTLVFRGDSLPLEAFQEGVYPSAAELNLADGSYTVEVELTGGSGRASIQSPTTLRVEDGKVYASILWGSSNYDYMRIGEERFEPVQEQGSSAFEIPVSVFDRKLTVFADTTAMSSPHEIEYTLCFRSATLQPAS